MHPEGGCSLQRWGTYTRLVPVECEIARYYCPESRTTFSLLPDFFAARMPGTLNVITNPTGAPNPIRKGPLQELLETKGSIRTGPPREVDVCNKENWPG